MTLLAPSQLLLPAGDCKHGRRFVLASREWLDLQARVEAVLQLPTTPDAMQARYGRAAAVTQSKDFFAVLFALRHAAGGFGSPQCLRTSLLHDPQPLGAPPRPGAEAFACAVWTMQRVGREALALASLFFGLSRPDPSRTATDTVALIKSRCLDQGQLVDTMERTVAHLNTLVARFQALGHDIEGTLQKARVHTAANSRTRKWLDAEIGTLSSSVVQWEQQRSDAWSRWLDLSLAAGIVPAALGFAGASPAVLLSAPAQARCFTTEPVPADGVAAIVAGALSSASGCARSSYHKLLDEVDDSDDFVAQCVRYRADIGALEQVAQHWQGACGAVVAQLRTVRDAWAAAARALVAYAGVLDTANLADSPWLRPGAMEAAADSWRALAGASGAFVQGALLETHAFGFGDLLPRDDPRWLLRFAARATA